MFTHCRLGRSSNEQTDQDVPERRLARYSHIACKSVAIAVEKRGKDGESVCVCTHVCVHVQRRVYMYECAFIYVVSTHMCVSIHMKVHVDICVGTVCVSVHMCVY